MMKRKNELFSNRRILFLDMEHIVSNPHQPRQNFHNESLRELSLSIRQYGILQPLTVRKKDGFFELVAGERRLRAARMAGLTEVPCIVVDLDNEQSSMLALIENLQRQDLDFVEEAEGIARLILTFGLSQEEAARKLGKSQSSVANKLRILKHAPEVLDRLRQHGLTERHARALLKLETTEEKLRTVELIVEHSLNVSQTEDLVAGKKVIDLPEEPEEPGEAAAREKKQRFVIKDVRLFMNTVRRAVDMMKRAGVDADMGREEDEENIRVTITIPKKAG